MARRPHTTFISIQLQCSSEPHTHTLTFHYRTPEQPNAWRYTRPYALKLHCQMNEQECPLAFSCSVLITVSTRRKILRPCQKSSISFEHFNLLHTISVPPLICNHAFLECDFNATFFICKSLINTSYDILRVLFSKISCDEERNKLFF